MTLTTLHGQPATFSGGMVEVAPDTFAWLQPNGDWSESNAGLVVGRDASALVDTAWDLPLTYALLHDVAITTPKPLTTVIATHGDGDHVNGFQLVPGAELIASEAAATDMLHERPRQLARSKAGARLLSRVAPGPAGRFGDYITSMMEPFDFRAIKIRQPDRTFGRNLSVLIGGRVVRLERLGPAHTAGDTIVHLPDVEVVFTGDLLFNGVTPNSWSGTPSGWRRALERIAALDASVLVPGHGPIASPAALGAMDQYWAWIEREASHHLSSGSSVYETARQIVFGDDFAGQPWSAWECPERTVLNVEIIARARRTPMVPILHRERPRLMWQVARLHHELRSQSRRPA